MNQLKELVDRKVANWRGYRNGEGAEGRQPGAGVGNRYPGVMKSLVQTPALPP